MPPGPPGRDYRNRFAANQNMETKQGGRDDHDPDAVDERAGTL
jgi:hypothetical protein